ncbi:MAG TPA: NHL repeat-containing protein [Chloroflexia bacterium]|nr:NHL repeat-containing protein [Chloroflexia bacterium]
MTSPPPAPAAPAAPPANGDRALYSWVFLFGIAGIVALLDPIVVDLRPHLEISLGSLGLGCGLLALGWTRGSAPARWAGVGVLWSLILAGLATQIAPADALPGPTIAPRAALLLIALICWLLLRDLPRPFWYGLVAVAVPTFAALAWLWLTPPLLARPGNLYWLATDSQGTLYASDADNGLIWVFRGDGSVRGKLRPRLAIDPRTPGPGIQPAGVRNELAPLVAITPTPGGPGLREFVTCGLAVDPQDRLYMVDILLRRVLRFDSAGRWQASWNLPDTYLPAPGCLAADSRHIYVADDAGHILIYDDQGRPQASWTLPQPARGLAPRDDGRLAVLTPAGIEIRQFPNGTLSDQWSLPAPPSPQEVPYQTILARRNGEILVSDITAHQVLRYARDHTPLPAISGAGGTATQLNNPGGLAEDPAGRLYVVDVFLRVIRRFDADGQPSGIWKTLLDEQEQD